MPVMQTLPRASTATLEALQRVDEESPSAISDGQRVALLRDGRTAEKCLCVRSIMKCRLAQVVLPRRLAGLGR